MDSRRTRNQKKCDNFNAQNAIGSRGVIRMDRGQRRETRTKSLAQIVPSGDAVIWLEGISGCYLLDRFDPFIEEKDSDLQHEERYIVIKHSDLRAAIDVRNIKGGEIDIFDWICKEVAQVRQNAGKQPLAYVVVESHWPEYKPVRDAIEARVGKGAST